MHVLIAWGDDLDRVDPGNEICVIFDVLRASTTIAAMLGRHARRVHITTSVEETLAWKEKDGSILACGERGGYPPEGFDHGNSPVEFLDLDLEQRDVVLTTSNFTRIADKVIKKDFTDVYSGALVNMDAIVSHVHGKARDEGKDIFLVPAGRKTHAHEDLVGAKHFMKKLYRLESHLSCKTVSLDPVEFERSKLEKLSDEKQAIFKTVREKSRHARYLLKEGFTKDVEFALQLDYFSGIIPVYDPAIHAFMNRA